MESISCDSFSLSCQSCLLDLFFRSSTQMGSSRLLQKTRHITSLIPCGSPRWFVVAQLSSHSQRAGIRVWVHPPHEQMPLCSLQERVVSLKVTAAHGSFH